MALSRKTLADLILIAGMLLASVGVGLVYLPAGLIVGGVCLAVFALLFFDVDKRPH
jgi:hypothetical protein